MEDKNKDLSTEELESVTGGEITDKNKPRNEEWREIAAAEGRNIFVVLNGLTSTRCTKCGLSETFFAREKYDIKFGFDEFRDVKCYNCGELIGNINTAGTYVS